MPNVTTKIETVRLAEEWLYSTLKNDATLSGLVSGRVIGGVGNVGTLTLPAAAWDFVASRDITSQDGLIVIDTITQYDVVGVGVGASWSTLTPIAERIQVLINGKAHTFAGGESLTCVRERIVQRIEEVAGVQYRYLGGTYRIRANNI